MTTGTDVLREALRARSRHGGYMTRLARDLGVGSNTLEEFSHGNGNLPPAVMQGVVKDIYHGHAKFDAERDLLVSTPPPSTVQAGADFMPKIDPAKLPFAQMSVKPPTLRLPAKGAPSGKLEPKPGWAK